MSKILFSVIEDEKLVEMVAKFDCLYDLASPLYKNQLIKDNAWREIAEQINRSVEDCKKRWRNIKDTYQKRVRKGNGTGSSALSKPKHWPLADMLTFLGKADYKRNISNIECDEEAGNEGTEINEDSQEPVEINNRSICSTSESLNEDPTQETFKSQGPPKNKRLKQNERFIQLLEERRNERKDIVRNMVQNHEDEVDVFFKSIAMSVKKLSPTLINEAKMKSLQMVFDLEARNAFVNIPHYSPTPSTESFSSQSLQSVNINNFDSHYEPNYEKL
ncbi:uncharacterized protein LOC111030965 isoform X2 [Myzus persicae]|uniref:uncharacterized protein LOC111030965 isoform X2 n=1 Tax=Myzus persicae TaxID=13164 RepID=UPI000B934606|nr:uncharacterized protein LOC111030965 isoform X2 [Myzus persicae]